MKKVLMVVVIVVFAVGAYVGFSVYKSSKAAGLVTELDKFVIPEKGFEDYLKDETLKKEDEPAPLFELKVRGDEIIPLMADIVRDSGKADNVRCGAAIVLGHTKKKASIDPLIDALQEKEGRLGECASIMLSLNKSDSIPEKLAEVLKSAKEQKIRYNAMYAITFWVTDDPKRKANKVVMQQVIKGLEEKDKPTRMMMFKNMKRLQFDFFADEGKSLGEELEEKVLPIVKTPDDEELAAAAAKALEFQYSYMTDQQKQEAIERVADLVKPDNKKHVRLNGVRLLKKLNTELAQNVATISQCNLTPLIVVLDSDDADLLKPTLETFTKCGTTREHRTAVKDFEKRIADEELKSLAGEAVKQILEREQGEG